MHVTDGRPLELFNGADGLVVSVQGRKVMVLPPGALPELADGLLARKVGEYEVAAVNDGRKVSVLWTVGATDPTIVKVGGRKVVQVDTENAGRFASALRAIDSGDSGPGEESSGGPVPAPESTESPAKQGAGAPVGKAPDATHSSDESPTATEDAPAPVPQATILNYYATFEGGVDLAQADPEDFALPERQQYRSWTQLTAYEECSWCYKRDRIDKRYQHQAWWNVGGTAVHTAIENFERAVADHVAEFDNPEGFLAREFATAFAKGIEQTQLDTGVASGEWRAANKGKEDGDWWWQTGTNMVLSYASQYRQGRNWQTWVNNEEPCLETYLTADFGETWFHGYLDRIDKDPRGLWVTDMKSGRQPKDHGQLIAYALALETTLGHEVAGARYYLTREARFVEFKRAELEPYFDAILYRFNQMHRAELAGLYLPNLSGYGHQCTFYRDMVY